MNTQPERQLAIFQGDISTEKCRQQHRWEEKDHLWKSCYGNLMVLKSELWNAVGLLSYMDVQVLSKSTGVVVKYGLGITKTLKNGQNIHWLMRRWNVRGFVSKHYKNHMVWQTLPVVIYHSCPDTWNSDSGRWAWQLLSFLIHSDHCLDSKW